MLKPLQLLLDSSGGLDSVGECRVGLASQQPLLTSLCAIPSGRPAGPERVRLARPPAELLRPPARRAHDFGRAPPARTDGAGLVSRCLRVGGVPCERVVGRGRREMCVLPAPPR